MNKANSCAFSTEPFLSCFLPPEISNENSLANLFMMDGKIYDCKAISKNMLELNNIIHLNIQ